MSVEEYLNMNYLKSGSLFEAAAALGAEAGTDDPEIVKRLSEFGKFFGNAYQIRDDMMDAFTCNNDHNSPNNDLLNGDISLPFIYALESKKILAVDKKKLMDVYTGRCQELYLVEIQRIYEETEALQKTADKMMEFAQQAREILKAFKDCSAKNGLMYLLEQYNSSLFYPQVNSINTN
jgi:geranylgeranyl pyrophosphate synthase